VWIQLLKQYRIKDSSGKRVPHFPGEILNIPNREMCLELIKDELAIGMQIGEDAPEGSGILYTAVSKPPGWIDALQLPVKHKAGALYCPYPVTIVLGPKARPHSIMLLRALENFVSHRWDIAAPIMSYRTLAEDVGTKGERERTEELVGDLRIPLYSTQMILMKDIPVVQELITAFKEEERNGEDRDLTFIRAIYRVKPIIWALQRSIAYGK